MLLFYSCRKQVEIPSYIHIEKFELSITDPNTQGTSSHKISDAWVFVNDKIHGIYELPATFPVIASGTNSLKIIAGIKDNGISANRVQYPFYEHYVENYFSFIPDSIVNATPIVKYFSSTKFKWIENFEDPGITIDSISPSDVRMIRITNPSLVFEGNGSGYAALSETKPIFRGVSNSAFSLPTGGKSVYLELNYKTTVSVEVKVISNNPSGVREDFALTINPTNKSGTAVWNKIYVNLTTAVSTNFTATDYRISFYSNLANDGVSSGEIYFDNIKLVHPP